MQRTYHRAIFDCFNEALARPLLETPENWKDCVIYDKIPRVRLANDLFEFEIELQRAKEFTLEWTSLLCGIIKDKEDSMMGNIKFMEPELINQLREERLFRMLSIDAVEKEAEWLNYDRYTISTLINCSEGVFGD